MRRLLPNLSMIPPIASFLHFKTICSGSPEKHIQACEPNQGSRPNAQRRVFIGYCYILHQVNSVVAQTLFAVLYADKIIVLIVANHSVRAYNIGFVSSLYKPFIQPVLVIIERNPSLARNCFIENVDIVEHTAIICFLSASADVRCLNPNL